MDKQQNRNQAHLPYRIIALDLDGTLTNHDKVITPKTREVLLKAQHEGAIVVLASGRPTYGIVPLANELKLDTHGGFILAYNGGKIVDWGTQQECFAQHLPPSAIPVIYEYAKRKGHALLGYAGNEIVTSYRNSKNFGDNWISAGYALWFLLMHLEPNPTKLLMTGEPTTMIVAEEELAEQLGDKMDVFRSAPFFLELVPKGIDKAQSLLRLLAKVNLTPADMIAFGDGYNDLSMLRLAGMGVAMANAAPEVRADADYVTLSNEEDGVAVAIERFLNI